MRLLARFSLIQSHIKMKSRGIKLFIALSLLCIVAIWLYRKYRVAPNVQLEQLELYNLDGSEFDATTLRGKTVFVNYWATWCGDCLQEMPSIETAYRNSDTNSVVFLLISDDPADKIQRYLSRNNYPMKFVRMNTRLQEIGVHSIPTTYLYDKNGKEVFTRVGSVDWSDPGMLQLIRNASEQ